MALNSPSNLSLGTLGHIAGGKGNTTSQTSLAGDCRGGASSTAMWADFKCGSLAMTLSSGSGYGSDGRGEFKIGLQNDVGTYMGGGSSISYISSSSISGLVCEITDNYYYYLNETNDGSLYESRIAQNSDNAGDYGAIFVDTTPGGSCEFTYQQDGTNKDQFRFRGDGGA